MATDMQLYFHADDSLQQNCCVQEEAAQSGLQRHFWWKLILPSQPSLECYISPHFNSIWWATDADLLHCWDFADKKPITGICPIRCSQGFKLTGVCVCVSTGAG